MPWTREEVVQKKHITYSSAISEEEKINTPTKKLQSSHVREIEQFSGKIKQETCSTTSLCQVGQIQPLHPRATAVRAPVTHHQRGANSSPAGVEDCTKCNALCRTRTRLWRPSRRSSIIEQSGFDWIKICLHILHELDVVQFDVLNAHFLLEFW